MADELHPMQTLRGSLLTVQCPPWCTQQHHGDDLVEHTWHEAPAITFNGPGEHGDDGRPYEAMWACLSAEPNREDGTYGTPYICFDTLSTGQGARLDIAAADAVLADLRLYVDRLQRMRDQLAAVTRGKGGAAGG